MWLKPLLPEKVHLVVLADSYFEGMRLFALCQQEKWTFISKLTSDRCFADTKTRIVSYGRELKEGLFRRHRLRRGKEGTAADRRQGPRKPRTHQNRAYEIYSQCRPGSKFSVAQVVYSC